MDLRTNSRAAVTAGILALGAGSYALLKATTSFCAAGTQQYASSICERDYFTGLNTAVCYVSTDPYKLIFQCRNGEYESCTNSNPGCS